MGHTLFRALGLGSMVVLWAGWSADSANAQAGSDFPFLRCRVTDLELRDFSVAPDANSPTGYTAVLGTNGGDVASVPVDVQAQGRLLRISGRIMAGGHGQQLDATVPLGCGDRCWALAGWVSGPPALIWLNAGLQAPARCAVAGPP